MRRMTRREREAFLAEPRIAVLSVAGDERTGQVSLTVQHTDPPYRYVTVEGTVVGADRRPAADEITAIAGRYMPAEHADGLAASELGDPEGTFVLYRVRPDRWLTADFSGRAE
jgi:uncharacterized protein